MSNKVLDALLEARTVLLAIDCVSSEPGEGETVLDAVNEAIAEVKAAPDLLEALKECATSAGATCHDTGLYARRLEAINNTVSEAIAKAT